MKLTPELIARRNNYSLWKYEDTVKNLERYENDNHKSRRLSVSECKTCFYLDGGRISPQAFRNYVCNHCENEYTHHNYDVPDYCPNCCKEHSVCRRCAANL